MSLRFDSFGKGKRYDGKQFYLTTLYPRVYPRLDDVVIVSQETDRLDTIAFKFYKDASLWWVIAKANGLGQGSLEIPPGTYLRIPKDYRYVLSLFNSINGL
jgi:hypothetical protein